MLVRFAELSYCLESYIFTALKRALICNEINLDSYIISILNRNLLYNTIMK